MTAIAKYLASKVPATYSESDILRQATLFFGAALFVFALSLTYGLDLSPGLF